MLKLFNINEATIRYFGSNQMNTKLILNYDQRDIVLFDEECLVTSIPNTIDELCHLSDGFRQWYTSAVEFNKSLSSDNWMVMKFYVDLIIDTTRLDTTKNTSSSYQSKITYSNKIKPYHDEIH